MVTFKLAGFNAVQREGIELTGSFAAKIDVELKVGALEETITVTGETPIVDVVNARKQATISNETINSIPTARLYHSLVTLVPGVSVSGTQDVGGIAGPTTVTFSMRGGPGNEGRLTVDGLSLGASLNGTGVSYTVADVGNAQEIVFTTAGQLGESEVGGPSMNLVPRQGGNRFSGTFFANGANDSLQSSNVADEIKALGLRAPQELLKIWDVNGAIGGPIKRDRLWFFAAARYQGNRKTAPNFVNANVDDVTKWSYVPDHGPGHGRRHVEERQRAADAPGLAAQQVQLLLGRAAALHAVFERQQLGHDCARGALQQSRAATRAAGHLVVARGRTGCCSRPGSAPT